MLTTEIRFAVFNKRSARDRKLHLEMRIRSRSERQNSHRQDSFREHDEFNAISDSFQSKCALERRRMGCEKESNSNLT